MPFPHLPCREMGATVGNMKDSELTELDFMPQLVSRVCNPSARSTDKEKKIEVRRRKDRNRLGVTLPTYPLEALWKLHPPAHLTGCVRRSVDWASGPLNT